VTAVDSELRALAAAVMFFTRLPVPARAGYAPADQARAMTYFPLVGWLVGGAAALVWGLALLAWSPAIASGLSLAATLLLTGALHEDGFADVCDGFGGGQTRERVLEIMRDSRIGAFGAIGTAVLIGLKWLTVASLPLALAPAALIAGHALSRGAAASLMSRLRYAQDTGKARPMAAPPSPARLIVMLALATGPLALLPARIVWTALAATAIVGELFARWFDRRIGGYTGDCLGAMQQVGEVVFYLTVLALA
jgi:adenosylcobinamide-GDP ribazoletransferase